jgi:hypothetical protein
MASTLLPMLTVMPQRDADCAIVALAVYLNVRYEDALEVASLQATSPHRKGLSIDEIIGAAKMLGVELIRRRKPDIENDHGILDIGLYGSKRKGHVAVLRWGLIFDSGSVWEPDAYQTHFEAKFGSLLTRKGE